MREGRGTQGAVLATVVLAALAVPLTLAVGGFGSVAFAVLATAGIVVAARLLAAPHDRTFLTLIALLAVLLRFVIVASLQTWLTVTGQGIALFDDENGYYTLSTELSLRWLGLPPVNAGVANEYLGNINVTNSYVYVAAALLWLFGPEHMVIKLFNSAVSVVAGLVVYRMAASLQPAAGRWAFVGMSVFPSLGLWSVVGLKDTYALALLVTATWTTFEFVRTRRWSWFFATLIPVLLMESVRRYLYFLLLVTWPVALLLSRGRAGVLPALLATVLSVGLIAVSPARNYLDPLGLFNIEGVRRAMAENARTAFVEPKTPVPAPTPPPLSAPAKATPPPPASTAVPDMRETIARLEPALQSSIRHAPVGLVHLAAAPFPWALRAFRDLALWPEMLVWYASLAYGLAWLFRMRSRAPVNLIGHTLAVAAALTVVLSLVEGNIGTLVRHRSMIIPTALILGSAGVAAYVARAGLRAAVMPVVSFASAETIVFFAPMISVGLPLFVPACPCEAGVAPNLAIAPLPELAIGGVFGVLVGGVSSWRRSLPLGLALGLSVAVLAAATRASAHVLQEGLLGTPYRLYVMGFIAGVVALALAAAVVVHERSREDVQRWLMRAFMISVALAAAGLAAERGGVTAALTLGGCITGVIVGMYGSRVRAIKSRAVVAVAVIGLLGVALRLAIAYQAMERSLTGRSWVEIVQLISGDTARIPDLLPLGSGYPLIAAALVTWSSPVLLAVTQATLAGVASFAVFALARALVPPWAACVAAVLVSLDIGSIRMAGEPTTEAILPALLLLGTLAFIHYDRSRRAGWLLLGGVLSGVSIFVHSVALLNAVVLFAWLIARRASRTSTAQIAVAALAGLFALLLAIAAFGAVPPLDLSDAALAGSDRGSVIERDRVSQLGHVALTVPARLTALFFAPRPGLFDPLVVASPALFPNALGGTVDLIRAAALIAGAVLLIGRRMKAHAVPVAWTILAHAAVFSLLLPSTQPDRYRTLVDPFLSVGAAWLVFLIVESVRRRWAPLSAEQQRLGGSA